MKTNKQREHDPSEFSVSVVLVLVPRVVQR